MKTARGLHALLLAAVLVGSATAVRVERSYSAPGGLTKSETPQFIVFSAFAAGGRRAAR